jgi:putative Holliday junction resolvase
MRLLGVDLGRKRIGLAVMPLELGVASPRSNLEASGTLRKDAEAIFARARHEEADAIVVGLPLNDDGSESPGARISRMLGQHLTELGADVIYQDERMTSMEAESAMREAGLKMAAQRKAVDGEAACLILERYAQGVQSGA